VTADTAACDREQNAHACVKAAIDNDSEKNCCSNSYSYQNATIGSTRVLRRAIPQFDITCPRRFLTDEADTSVKQTVTSFNVGVSVLFAEEKMALYFRYRFPLNCASEAPLLK
jgi:hypothetical protein